MEKMKIDIWSDIACPYCYIGLRKLSAVLDKFEHKSKVELVWHSYQLSPDMEVSSQQNYYQHLAEELDLSLEDVKKNTNKVGLLGAEVSIDFRMDKVITTNTSYALRLVKLAAEKGTATLAEDLLFEAYFIDGKNISNEDTLLEIGQKVNVAPKDIAALFTGVLYKWEVQQDTKYADEDLNLDYIPYYIFNNEHIIQGSVDTEDYARILEQSFAEWQKHGVSTKRGDVVSGQACAVDGSGCE